MCHPKTVPCFRKSLDPVVGCWLELGPLVGVRGDLVVVDPFLPLVSPTYIPWDLPRSYAAQDTTMEDLAIHIGAYRRRTPHLQNTVTY